MKKRYVFTPEMISELLRDYPNTSTEALARCFGCSIRKIHEIAGEHKVKKDIAYIKELSRKKMEDPDHPARKHWKQKGCIPPNKGKKQIEYMTPEAIERTKATQFKKGQLGWNYKPIGYERVNIEGYIEIKVADPNVFKLKQRLVWESNFGPIPPGHNIQFKDKNRLNCEPDNLYCISRANQLKSENSFIARYPKDLQLAIQSKAMLTRQINKLNKQQQNEHE